MIKAGGGPGHADLSPDNPCFGQGGLRFECSNDMRDKDADMKKQVLFCTISELAVLV